MLEKLSNGDIEAIRLFPIKTKFERMLLSHIDALQEENDDLREENEGYKLMEQIHINRLKIAEGGNRNVR